MPPGRGDVILSFEHSPFASCAVHICDMDHSVLKLWHSLRQSWTNTKRCHPEMLLGARQPGLHLCLAFLENLARSQSSACSPTTGGSSSACQDYSAHVSKALSPCGRFLAIYSGAELHILSGFSGQTVAHWQLGSLAPHLRVLLLPPAAQLNRVKWALGGFQLWVRMKVSVEANEAGVVEAGELLEIERLS